MSTTRTLSALIGSGTLVMLIALGMSVPMVTEAQCGGDIESPCYKCHQETHPVCGTTEWHSEYGHRYACWNCHGGNDTAQDKDLAHVGLVRNPLADAFPSCFPCHPEDYRQLAERFAKTLDVAVSFREPVSRSLASAASIIAQPIVTPPIVEPAISPGSSNWAWILWLSPVPVVVVLIWFMWTRRIP
jgi:hypothetical protein